MKKLIFLSLLSVASFSSFACPNLVGEYNRCEMVLEEFNMGAMELPGLKIIETIENDKKVLIQKDLEYDENSHNDHRFTIGFEETNSFQEDGLEIKVTSKSYCERNKVIQKVRWEVATPEPQTAHGEFSLEKLLDGGILVTQYLPEIGNIIYKCRNAKKTSEF